MGLASKPFDPAYKMSFASENTDHQQMCTLHDLGIVMRILCICRRWCPMLPCGDTLPLLPAEAWGKPLH